jgi:hypothetical protein
MYRDPLRTAFEGAASALGAPAMPGNTRTAAPFVAPQTPHGDRGDLVKLRTLVRSVFRTLRTVEDDPANKNAVVALLHEMHAEARLRYKACAPPLCGEFYEKLHKFARSANRVYRAHVDPTSDLAMCAPTPQHSEDAKELWFDFTLRIDEIFGEDFTDDVTKEHEVSPYVGLLFHATRSYVNDIIGLLERKHRPPRATPPRPGPVDDDLLDPFPRIDALIRRIYSALDQRPRDSGNKSAVVDLLHQTLAEAREQYRGSCPPFREPLAELAQVMRSLCEAHLHHHKKEALLLWAAFEGRAAAIFGADYLLAKTAWSSPLSATSNYRSVFVAPRPADPNRAIVGMIDETATWADHWRRRLGKGDIKGFAEDYVAGLRVLAKAARALHGALNEPRRARGGAPGLVPGHHYRSNDAVRFAPTQAHRAATMQLWEEFIDAAVALGPSFPDQFGSGPPQGTAVEAAAWQPPPPENAKDVVMLYGASVFAHAEEDEDSSEDDEEEDDEDDS